ncbi:hypothetical protein [Roseovarius sp. MMSF_3281]|uniref:hypothetical protein n=1 Tax=Roseovarius sp. MMSF_3281 TaxID=3046694 RepID=UPI00273DD6F0|nr:hypothetical protein [Roseovarius sp. MMSF_3281]
MYGIFYGLLLMVASGVFVMAFAPDARRSDDSGVLDFVFGFVFVTGLFLVVVSACELIW